LTPSPQRRLLPTKNPEFPLKEGWPRYRRGRDGQFIGGVSMKLNDDSYNYAKTDVGPPPPRR